MIWWPFKRKPEPAPEPESQPVVDTRFVALARQRPCKGPDECRLVQNYWCGLPVWQCPACQFETFSEKEAERFTSIGEQKHG